MFKGQGLKPGGFKLWVKLGFNLYSPPPRRVAEDLEVLDLRLAPLRLGWALPGVRLVTWTILLVAWTILLVTWTIMAVINWCFDCKITSSFWRGAKGSVKR
jgi:hypothetical protein